MKKMLVAGSLLGGVVLGGAVAFATAPTPDTTINACVKKDGNIRILVPESDKGCKKDEVPLSWNRIGPAGPQGSTGPQGPAALATFANVRADGTLVNGQGVTSSVLLDSATFGSGYVINFDRTVESCAPVASAGQTGAGIAQSDAIANSNVNTLGSNVVFVQFKSATGGFVDTDFHLILACP